MNIWIEPAALVSTEGELPRPGALYGLIRMQQSSHRLGWDPSKLSQGLTRLLENEPLKPELDSADEAQLIISTGASGELLAINSRNSDKKAADDQEEDFDSVARDKNSAAGARDKSSTDGARDENSAITDQDKIVSASGWVELTRRLLFPDRKAARHRKTAETEIEISLNLDGKGQAEIETGLSFFDHMLEQIARHGLIDLAIRCKGDLNVDEHHTIEDTAITLGDVISEAVGTDKAGILRYGYLLPMDEAVAEVALDLSNRPYLVWETEFSREYVGDFPTEMAEHFFHTLAMQMRATLQIRCEGRNDHHKIESIFKGFARALRFAVTRTERAAGILPSTKENL